MPPTPPLGPSSGSLVCSYVQKLITKYTSVVSCLLLDQENILGVNTNIDDIPFGDIPGIVRWGHHEIGPPAILKA